MPFTLTTSAREVSKRLDPLQYHLQDVYNRLGYPPFVDLKGDEPIKDVRAATLMICKSDITSNILVLNIIARMSEGVFSLSTWRFVIGLDDETIPIEWVIDKLSNYLRLAFVTMFQFHVENMLVNIFNVLDANKVTRSYRTNTKNLLRMISIHKIDQMLDTLMILQNIRNSLHSNGVHNNPRLTIAIKDCTFDFQRGQPVNCASWAHIVVATEATIDVLEKILNTPEIRAIPAPIIDHYIEQD